MAKSKRLKTDSENADEIAPEKISMRAYEKWRQRGMPHGSDQQDWYEAEAELRTESAKKPGATSRRQSR